MTLHNVKKIKGAVDKNELKTLCVTYRHRLSYSEWTNAAGVFPNWGGGHLILF